MILKKKWSSFPDRAVNPALNYFGERVKIPYLYQIIFTGGEDVIDGKVRVISASKFLGPLP